MKEVFMIVDKRSWAQASIHCCFLNREDAETELDKFREDIRENAYFHSLANEDDLMDNTYIKRLEVK